MAENQINDRIEINHDNAVLLLAAAEELGLDQRIVETTSDGRFRVPQEVVDKAGLGEGKKAPSESKVEKAAEAVTSPDAYGDPMTRETKPAESAPRESSDAANAAAQRALAKQVNAQKTAAKKAAPAKKAAAKKAAATETKSE